MRDKIYYAVYTTSEKIWIRADMCEVTQGCLTFFDLDDESNKIVIASFTNGYWQYMYEADADTGESIKDQIPFWKPHVRHEVDNRRGLPQRSRSE
jgi:hypothetical protein